MKLTKYLLANLLITFSISNAIACINPWYSVAAYNMYRVYEPKIESDDIIPTKSENCAEWQKLTSAQISKKDIEQVVYKMSLKEFQEMYDNRDKKYKNKFSEWITKNDTAILEFLLLAKTNE